MIDQQSGEEMIGLRRTTAPRLSVSCSMLPAGSNDTPGGSVTASGQPFRLLLQLRQTVSKLTVTMRMECAFFPLVASYKPRCVTHIGFFFFLRFHYPL